MRRRNFIKLAAKASVAAAIAADPVARLSASIIARPKRQVAKPSGAVCINWGHPLATSLSCVLPFNEAGGIVAATKIVAFNAAGQANAIINGSGGVLQGTPSWVQNTPGPGLKFNNTGDFLQMPNLLAAVTTGATVLIIRRKTDTTLRFAASFGPGGSNSPFAALIPYSNGDVLWDFGGDTAPNRLTLSGLSWAAVVEMWAFTAGPAGSAIWKNGQKLASQSTAITRAAGGELRVNSAFGTFGDLQEFYFFAVANQQWSDSLVSWWFAEPYGMLVPQSPTMRYFFGGTGRKKTNVFVAM
jgi:hypothetical protein